MQRERKDEEPRSEARSADQPVDEATEARDLAPTEQEAKKVKGGAVGPCFKQ